MKKYLKNNVTFIALIILGIVLSFLSNDFLTPRNLSNLTNQVTIIGIMAVGMTMVIIIGGIDLSVGSIVGLSAIVVTMLMQAGLNSFLSILITIFVCGITIGLWNGFWIAHYKIPSFIITLGMMTIARGIALTISNGSSIPVTNEFFSRIGGDFISKGLTTVILGFSLLFLIYLTINQIKKKKLYNISINFGEVAYKAILSFVILGFFFYVFVSYNGIPYPVAIFIFISILGIFILNKTKFGRRIYALGGNEEAARLSGINIYKTKIYVYIIMSSLSAISGIILASRLNGASPNLGTSFELDAIAAVVIGGTSLSGGFGTITGSIIGTFLIGILNNGMSLLGVNTFYQLIVKGGIIIVAVWFDIINKGKTR